MKISQEHYNKLEQAINKVPRYAPHASSEKRTRWDTLRSVVIDGVGGIPWICDNLYPYLDDTHIDSALRKIFKHKKEG